jgi:hypothetical protein
MASVRSQARYCRTPGTIQASGHVLLACHTTHACRTRARTRCVNNTCFLHAVLQGGLAQFRQAVSAAFAAGPRAPALVDALQQMAAADRSLWLSPQHLLAAAEASGGLGAAAVQVEEQMLYAGAPDACRKVSYQSALLGRVLHMGLLSFGCLQDTCAAVLCAAW